MYSVFPKVLFVALIVLLLITPSNLILAQEPDIFAKGGGKGGGKKPVVHSATFRDAPGDNFTSDGDVYIDGEDSAVCVDNIPRLRGWEKAWSKGFCLDTLGRNNAAGFRQATFDLAGMLDVNVDHPIGPVLTKMKTCLVSDVKVYFRPVVGYEAFDDNRIEPGEIVAAKKLPMNVAVPVAVTWGDVFNADCAEELRVELGCEGIVDDEAVLVRMGNLRDYWGTTRQDVTVTRTDTNEWKITAGGGFSRVGSEWSKCGGIETAVWPGEYEIIYTSN